MGRATPVTGALLILTGLGGAVACSSNRAGDTPRERDPVPAEKAAMDNSSSPAVGEHWVWRGQGLARVEAIAPDGDRELLHLVIVGRGMKVGLPAANVDRALRRLVDRATATRLWTELAQPAEADTRGREDRHFDEARTLAKGSLEDQVLRLRRMYSSPFKPTFGERKLIDTYEQVVFSELGHVLGRPIDDLRTEMQALHPVFAPTATERPPEPARPAPVPEGPTFRRFELLGRFAVERGLVIADPAYMTSEADQRSGLNHRVAALPGTWYGYAIEDAKLGRVGVLIAVHASKVEVKPSRFGKDPLTALRKAANVVASVRVDGGQMAVIDQAVRDDERFGDDLAFRTAHGTVLDRGCTTESGAGDGTYPVAVVMEDGQAVYVQVDFR